MYIAKLLINLSMFVFLFPPVRQYKGRYFYYFLLLALEDPVGLVLLATVHLPQIITHLMFTVLLIVSVLKQKDFLKNIHYAVPLIVLLSASSFYLSPDNMRIVLAMSHVVVFFVILKQAVENTREKRSIDLFYIMLVLYESTIILKFINRVFDINNGILFFYITLTLEILLGVFFSLFRGGNRRLCFTVPGYEEPHKLNNEIESKIAQ